MDSSIWRFIKWDSGEMETFCSDCFKADLFPAIQFIHYPDTRWIKTSKGSFRMVALGIEAVGRKSGNHARCRCTKCGSVRHNELFVEKNQMGTTRKGMGT